MVYSSLAMVPDSSIYMVVVIGLDLPSQITICVAYYWLTKNILCQSKRLFAPVGYKNLRNPRSTGSPAPLALFRNMKNSTLLRLFFISIGLPLTCASLPLPHLPLPFLYPSSTSSALTSKPKPKPASLLVDTTNSAPAVQLKDQGILVQSVPEESQVSGRDEQTKKFEELINKRQYKEIAELGKEMSDEELLKCLCQVVTSLDHFKGLYEYLKQRNMVPGFLAHGEMVVVRKVIVETDLLETDDVRSSVTVSTMQLPCHSRKTAMNVLQVFLKLHKKDPTGRTSSTGL